MKPASLSSFIVITQTLLNHVVTDDVQVYHIECMRNLEPLCCEVQCGWQQENITEEGQCDVFGNYMMCAFPKETRNLTTPSKLRKIASAARCKIYKKKQNFHVSCYHDGKPICCDTPCECDLNLLNATCTMQEKSMECSCAGSGSGDSPALNFCFKNTCLHKTTNGGCDFKADDTCYILTGVTNGKGQEQKSKQEMKDNVTPKPDNQCSAINNEGQCLWIGISGIVLGILISWIYTREKTKRKHNSKRKESFLEDKDEETKTPADEGQEEYKPCLQQYESVKNTRQRISSCSDSEPSGSGNKTGTLY